MGLRERLLGSRGLPRSAERDGPVDQADREAPTAPAEPPTYSALVPAVENGFRLFPGIWTSRLPDRMDIDGPGSIGLFEDARIAWMLSELGGIAGFDVLELGPLEGAHTYMLEQAGGDVLAIEAGESAFLRCLITKNALGLRARFALGDFTKSFAEPRRWDLVVASGVLYHMTDPIRLLERISEATDRLYLWTHWFDPDTAVWNPSLQELIGEKWRIDNTVTTAFRGREVRMVPQGYGASLGWGGFCGGPEDHSYWLYRDDLLAILAELRFRDVRIAFDNPGHQNGPCCSILAQR